MQHAPTAVVQGELFGAQEADALVHAFVPVQAFRVVIEQPPVTEQQVPTLQSVAGVQEVPKPCHTPSPHAPTPVPGGVRVQVPTAVVLLQQAPTQGLGEQSEPAPWNRNVLSVVGQPAALVIVQVPMLLQQAPVVFVLYTPIWYGPEALKPDRRIRYC